MRSKIEHVHGRATHPTYGKLLDTETARQLIEMVNEHAVALDRMEEELQSLKKKSGPP